MKLNSMIFLFALVLLVSCVKNDVTNITLNKTSSYLIIGQTDTLSAGLTATGDIKDLKQSWSSSNQSVASVENGIISAIGGGSAVITVKVGDKSSSCDVTVDDNIIPVLTKGSLWYFGDAYGVTDIINGTGSNDFVLYLASSGINLDSLSGVGEILMIEMNISMSVKDSLPVGTYDMMTDLTHNIGFAPFTLIPAFVQDEYPYGCWYFGILIDPITNGNIVVTRANTIYTINYEFFDYYGLKISGKFQGTLDYINGTIQPANSSLKNRMKLKTDNGINKSMKFKRR